MRSLRRFRILVLAVCCFWLPVMAMAAEPQVAVFPFQELGEGRNDANLPFSRVLAERLAESGNKIIGLDTVITFMANNRIRTLGHLDPFRISQSRNELGADFVLFGTITQRKERPEPSMGVTLNLVRTSDARTVWSYATSLSTGEDRKVLGIGEPKSTDDLQPLLIGEIIEQWPWRRIREVQQVRAINIESATLTPKYVRPGDEVHSRVRLRDTWPASQAPRIFFKAADQLYPATLAADGSTYEGTWVAGDENGLYPVTLVLEWSSYGRTESTMLGSYVVDGKPPVLDLSLRGATIIEGVPVFNRMVEIVPQLLVHKQLSRWRLAFYFESGNLVGDMDGVGQLPKNFIWTGRDASRQVDNGNYQVVIEVWDLAGNMAKASKWVEIDRSVPQLTMAVDRTDEGMVVGLNNEGKVPLAYWRMEMWTKEGRMLTEAEGQDLPVKVDVKLTNSEEERDLRGVVVFEDIFGNEVRTKVEDLLPSLVEEARTKAEAEAEAEKKKGSGTSESWVNEF